ncbi:YaiI/YqxD family protein [Niallia sp. 03133]|uniref:YaiI/YqxD family protein n=1 Tax=Niallia sp. 03133 TaxID=3458060 RepID=UPI0040445264
MYVDADSCPVKQEIVEIAKNYYFELLFIASYAHMTKEQEEMKWKYVDSSKEAVDLFIMNKVKKQDIVITQDIGLASTLLLKGVYVLSPRGIVMEEKDIQTALDMRYLSAKARRRGIYGKGPKSFSEDDRQRFKKNLKRILSKIEGV